MVHLEKRLKIYQDQKFDYTIQKVKLYEDDGTTLLHTFSVSSDKNTRTPV
jgi:hypothetical protein